MRSAPRSVLNCVIRHNKRRQKEEPIRPCWGVEETIIHRFTCSFAGRHTVPRRTKVCMCGWTPSHIQRSFVARMLWLVCSTHTSNDRLLLGWGALFFLTYIPLYLLSPECPAGDESFCLMLPALRRRQRNGQSSRAGFL